MREQRQKLYNAYEEFVNIAKRYPKNIRMSHKQYEVFQKVLEYIDMKTFQGCRVIVSDSVVDGEYIFN